MPSRTPDALSSAARAVKERPVSRDSTPSAAYANALDSETQPGEAGVCTGGAQRDPRTQRPADSIATWPTLGRERRMPLPRGAGRLRDQLDQPRHERQPRGAVRHGVPVTGLPLEGEVTDHRDRARRLIRALCAPGRDGGVVERAVEEEVEPHVVMEASRSCAAGIERLGEGVPADGRSVRCRGHPSCGRRPDHRDRRVLVPGVGRDADGWRPRVDRQPSGRGRQREAVNVTPLRPDEALALRGNRSAARRLQRERERLPEGRVVDRRAGLAHDQWAVLRDIRGVDVVQRLQRAIVAARGDRGRRDAVPERGGELPLVLVKPGE